MPTIAESYNALSPVEVADARRRELDDFEDTLGRFADIVRRHDAPVGFGLRLLHRHFTIGDDEKMVEYAGWRGTATLETRPVAQSAATTAHPSLWQAKNGSWEPLEWTTDRAAVIDGQRVSSRLAAAVATLLADTGLDSLFGIGLTRREDLPLDINQRYYEETYPDASVVTIRDGGLPTDGSEIQTAWVPQIVAGCAWVPSGCAQSCGVMSGGDHKVHHDPQQDHKRGDD